jgi:uncharacterized protein (DUF885 family)
MKKFLVITILAFISLSSFHNLPGRTAKDENALLSSLLEEYFNKRMEMLPIEATFNGEPGHNDKLVADFTDSYRLKLKEFFSHYLSSIKKINREQLDESGKISYDVVVNDMEITLDGIALGYFAGWYPDHRYMPMNQYGCIPLALPQIGSGTGAQPFKTVKDYKDWEKRATAFSAWADSAIVYFRKGMAANIVLPEALVKKMIPQMEALLVSKASESVFYGPVNNFPPGFSDQQKKEITSDYTSLINQQLLPSYKKLGDFLKNEYLPKARKTTGLGVLPGESKVQYKWLIRYWTTTGKTADEIYATGLSEVKRVRRLMDSVRQAVGFKGSMSEFFAHMKTDKKFMPFKTPAEVLKAYHAVEQNIGPNLKKMFNHVPKTKFEIRQTEAFRAASASAQYYSGLPDGSRPGIFYVPIIDATEFNVTTGIEALFLHEAIPGHHYQASLQNENEKLSKFQRFYSPGAYAEGWRLYCESLGKELGLYTDPYEYFGALGKEMHRSIRLVVDVAMHSRNMTREQAIQYMMDNMPGSEAAATAEIERYMAVPAQALSYKIGSLKIQELRRKYESQQGNKFNLAAFHDAILSDGSMPLETLERKMDAWAERY